MQALLTVESLNKNGKLHITHSDPDTLENIEAMRTRLVASLKVAGWQDVPMTKGRIHLRKPTGKPPHFAYEHKTFIITQLPGREG